jgi:hypothetical protein
MIRRQAAWRIYILPPHPPRPSPPTLKTDLRRVVVQNLGAGDQGGVVLPIRKCQIKLGKNEKEVVLRNPDSEGHFLLGLDGASIQGKEVTVAQAKAKLMEMLHLGSTETNGKRISEGWVDGPILAKSRSMKR